MRGRVKRTVKIRCRKRMGNKRREGKIAEDMEQKRLLNGNRYRRSGIGGLTCYDDDLHGHKMLITKKTATRFPHQVKLDLLACFSYQQDDCSLFFMN